LRKRNVLLLKAQSQDVSLTPTVPSAFAFEQLPKKCAKANTQTR